MTRRANPTGRHDDRPRHPPRGGSRRHPSDRDLLLETANEYLAGKPWRALVLLRQLVSGRAKTKEFLAERTTPDVSVLPYNEELLRFLREERATGRRIVLATASSRLLADRVAEHLGV